MEKNAIKIRLGIVLTLMGACLLIPLLCLIADQITLIILSANLGIEPNQKALHAYINSQIKVGVPRRELHQRIEQASLLRRISPMKTPYGENCEDIEIRLSFLVWRPEHWVVCYDENEKIISVSTYSQLVGQPTHSASR